MKYKKLNEGFICWLSETDTNQFFNNWPCSTIEGKRVKFEIFRSDLVDISINNRDISKFIDQYELTVLINDYSKRISDLIGKKR